MSDRFRQAAKKFWNRAEEEQWVYGRMGRRNADLSFTYEVPGRRGFVYVTIRTAGNAQTVVPARNDGGVPHNSNYTVKMRLRHGVYVIDSKTGEQTQGSTPATPPSGVVAHATSHQHGGTDEVATATPTANSIPKSGADGTLDNGWLNITETVQDVVGAFLVQGAGITLTYDDIANTLTIASSINQYTDEMAQDAVGSTLTDSATVDFTYDDTANTITAIVKDNSIGTAKVQDEAITLAKLLHIPTDTLLGRSTAGVGDVEQIALTAFGRSLIDDANAAAARTTLELVAGGAGDIWVEKGGDTMTGALTLGISASGALLAFTGGYSITEGANVFNTGIFRGSSDNALVLTIVRGAASEALMGAGVNGDAFRRFLLQADGTLLWGSGALTRDTNLYRASADHLKTDDALLVAAGSGDEAEVGGLLYQTSTQVGVSGALLTDLASYSLPASTLNANGQSLWFEAWGSTVSNANAKTLHVVFGGSYISSINLTAGSANNWYMRGRVHRTGASSEIFNVGWWERGHEFDQGTAGEALTSSLNVKVQGQGGANNDILLKGFVLGWDNNNT